MDMIYKLMDELDTSAELMLKEVKKINQKGDLTPQELESLKCIEETLKNHLINNAMLESSDDGGWDNYSEMGPVSYRYDHRMSGRRGRSPVTGRYVSRENYGMSNHSIDDRIVAHLEDMMGEAKNDYEKKRIEEWMHKVREDEANR